SAQVVAVGGIPPRTWSIPAGLLPPGLSLNAATGLISGPPTTPGLFNFTVQVTDAALPQQTDTKALSIRNSNALQILTTSLPPGPATTFYNQTVLTSGGFGPFTFTLIGGALPPGLNLSVAGVISGTPTAVGVFNFTVKVTDSSSPSPLVT